MHPGQSLIPHALPPEWMPPGEGALDHPARQAEMTAMCRAPLADIDMGTLRAVLAQLRR
jgi:hypothetical protein